MIYIEYVSRRSGITLEDFWAITGHGQRKWVELNPEDRVILNLGRTWRLGDEPEYLTVVETDFGLERLDRWDLTFKGLRPPSELDYVERAYYMAARIDKAGIFDPLLDPLPGRSGVYYVEAFTPLPDCAQDDIRTLYDGRTTAASDVVLHLLAIRVGLLGPDPGLAIWSGHSFESLSPVVTSVCSEGPVRPLRGALYANVGHEIL